MQAESDVLEATYAEAALPAFGAIRDGERADNFMGSLGCGE